MGPSLALSYGTTLPIPYELILVDLARFERATSTFAESRSDSSELQVHDLAEGTGVEPASAMRGGFQDHCLTS